MDKDGGRVYLLKNARSKPPFSSAVQRIKELLSAKVIMVGLTVLTIIAIFSWFGIKKALAQSRIDELLPEFVQVTDKFTRPKVFVHKTFVDIPGEGQPRHFASRLRAYSDGRFRMPEIVPIDGNDIYDYGYDLVINLNDTIWAATSWNELNNQEFFEYAVSLANREDINLDVRIKVSKSRKITSGDYTIKGTELAAFMKTLELTHLFKTVSE